MMDNPRLTKAQVQVLRRMESGATLSGMIGWEPQLHIDSTIHKKVRHKTIKSLMEAEFLTKSNEGWSVDSYRDVYQLTDRARTYLKEFSDV